MSTKLLVPYHFIATANTPCNQLFWGLLSLVNLHSLILNIFLLKKDITDANQNKNTLLDEGIL
jgi:hypothetical protein